MGSRVKFAGWPSKRSPERIYALNMLAADGQEILLFRTATPRWRDTTIGFGAEEAQAFYREGVASDTLSLFRRDMIRTFHMTGAADPATQPRTPLGYSVGRWEGTTLVVETSRVSAPHLNANGVPLGSNARLVERFTPTATR